MSKDCRIKNVIIKKGVSFYLLFEGTVYLATVVNAPKPRERNGRTVYDIQIKVSNNLETGSLIYISTADPFIKDKIFPTASLLQNFLNIPFETGDTAYIIGADNPYEVSEVKVIIDPTRARLLLDKAVVVHTYSIFRTKDKDGEISDELLYNYQFRNLFKSKEEAKVVAHKMLASKLAYLFASINNDITSDYLVSMNNTPISESLVQAFKMICDINTARRTLSDDNEENVFIFCEEFYDILINIPTEELLPLLDIIPEGYC